MTSLSLVLLLTVGLLWSAVRRKRDVSPLFALAMLSYVFLWNAFPIAYGVTLLDWSAASASLPVYQRVVVLHLTALLAAMSIFALAPSRVSVGIRDVLGDAKASPAVARAALAIGFAVYVLLLKQMLALRGGSYAQVTAFVMTASSSEAGQVAILETVSYFVLCLAMACLIATWARHAKTIMLLAWGVVALHVLSGLIQGVRAVILLPLTLLVAVNLQRVREGHRAQWKMVAVVFGATVLLAPLLAAAMGLMRLRGSESLDVQAVQQGYDMTVASLSVEQRARLATQEMNTKLDAFSYGASLLENDGVATAGWKPYSSALLSPIPRLLLPDKPVPTSKNGENSGTPYRVAGQPFGDVDLGMVVPVSPVAVSIWELGYWAPVLVVILNVLAWLVANSLLASRSIFARAIGISLLALPSAEFFFGAPSGIVRDMMRCALTLFALWLVIQGARSIRRQSARQLVGADRRLASP